MIVSERHLHSADIGGNVLLELFRSLRQIDAGSKPSIDYRLPDRNLRLS